jgi:hypothetical protein
VSQGVIGRGVHGFYIFAESKQEDSNSDRQQGEENCILRQGLTGSAAETVVSWSQRSPPGEEVQLEDANLCRWYVLRNTALC